MLDAYLSFVIWIDLSVILRQMGTLFDQNMGVWGRYLAHDRLQAVWFLTRAICRFGMLNYSWYHDNQAVVGRPLRGQISAHCRQQRNSMPLGNRR